MTEPVRSASSSEALSMEAGALGWRPPLPRVAAAARERISAAVMVVAAAGTVASSFTRLYTLHFGGEGVGGFSVTAWGGFHSLDPTLVVNGYEPPRFGYAVAALGLLLAGTAVYRPRAALIPLAALAGVLGTLLIEVFSLDQGGQHTDVGPFLPIAGGCVVLAGVVAGLTRRSAERPADGAIQPCSAAETTARASSCTCARCSEPRNDSA